MRVRKNSINVKQNNFKRAWYAGVTNGTEQAVAAMLSKNAEVLKILESSIIFRSGNIIECDFINNLFCVMSEFRSKSLAEAVETVIKHGHVSRYDWFPSEARTFRVIFMENGKLCSIKPFAQNLLERLITKQTDMTVNRAKPDMEIWLNRHNTGRTFFMQRIGKNKKKEGKGELAKSISSALM